MQPYSHDMRKYILSIFTLILILTTVSAQEQTVTATNDTTPALTKKELRKQRVARRNFHYNILGGPSYTPFIGRKYQHDEVFCYVSTPWGEYEKIMTGFTGRVVEVCAQQGANVNKGDVIAYIQRSDIFA